MTNETNGHNTEPHPIYEGGPDRMAAEAAGYLATKEIFGPEENRQELLDREGHEQGWGQ